MIPRYARLRGQPAVFQSLTGLRVVEFGALVRDRLPAYRAAEERRLGRPDRQRAITGGSPAGAWSQGAGHCQGLRPPRRRRARC